MDELRKENANLKEQLEMLHTDIHILELEHIQDYVSVNHSFGISINETLTKMGRMDLYEWMTDKDTGLNTKEYPLGHALKADKEVISDKQRSYENQVAIESNDIGW